MLVIENHYQNVTSQLRQGIENLWRSENVLTDQNRIEERLRQVVMVVRDSATGKLAGVSTAQKRKMPALNNHHLYEFRCFIGEVYRVAGLDVKLSRMTFDFLESIRDQDEHKPIGIFSVLENEKLKQEPVWRRAVWPELEMYFVGYTNSGNPIRVHYFKNARI
jgi:hypothetical protein